MGGFASAIELDKEWPISVDDPDEMDIDGILTWATAYLRAAELLHFDNETERHSAFYCGPVVQNVGLATELTLKALLRGAGQTSKTLKKFSHNTYSAYFEARKYFNELKFIELHFSNTAHLSVPDEIRRRSVENGEHDFEVRWRVYFDHLRLLDTVYDRPYRSRYISPGDLTLPETEIVIIGTKIFLSAMTDRFNDLAKVKT